MGAIFKKRKHKYLKAFHDLAARIIEPYLQIWAPCFVPCTKPHTFYKSSLQDLPTTA